MYNKSTPSFYSNYDQCDYNVRSEHIVLSTVPLCKWINSNYVAMFMDHICIAFVVCLLAFFCSSLSLVEFMFFTLYRIELKGGTKDLTKSISISPSGQKYQMHSAYFTYLFESSISNWNYTATKLCTPCSFALDSVYELFMCVAPRGFLHVSQIGILQNITIAMPTCKH